MSPEVYTSRPLLHEIFSNPDDAYTDLIEGRAQNIAPTAIIGGLLSHDIRMHDLDATSGIRIR